MDRENQFADLNLTIAGAAGQGLVTISDLLLKALAGSGFHVFASQDYMSRVRGGHNFMRIRVGEKPSGASPEESDILVALDQASVDLHKTELRGPKILIYDPDAVQPGKIPGATQIPLPLLRIAKEKGGTIFGNTVAFGALSALLGLSRSVLTKTLTKRFLQKGKEIAEKNISAAMSGRASIAKNHPDAVISLKKSGGRKRMLINGAKAIGLGMIAGGIRFITAYPMSPSTGIFTYVTAKAKKMGIISEQAEDEIAAVNMAIGASAAGARTAVTTSGGGLALMAEGVSLSGINECPVVIANIQRPGPATGLPTRTGQEDLDFVLNIGHGEFPRFLFAPGTPEEAFYTSVSAMNLADKYQVPAFILGDQHLVDSYMTIDRLDLNRVTYKSHLLDPAKIRKPYLRYRFTRSGVSPRSYYLQTEERFMVDSHTHTEDGHITEDREVARKMVEKRFLKLKGMKKEGYGPQYYGDEKAATVFVCWGSTLGALREAVDFLNSEGKRVGMIHFNRIWPFPVEETLKLLKTRKNIHVVEGNFQSQFGRLLKRETGLEPQTPILRYDGRPFNPNDLISRIKEIYSWRT